MRVTGLVLAAILAAVMAGGGVYFWQSSVVKEVRAEAAATSNKLTVSETKLKAAESELRTNADNLKTLQQSQEQLLVAVKQLQDAVRIGSSAKDLATAYGRARVSRNDAWIIALLTPQLRTTYMPFPNTSAPKPTRFELRGSGENWVVKVYEGMPDGEIGYSEASLTIQRLSDGYFWITDHKVAAFVNTKASK